MTKAERIVFDRQITEDYEAGLSFKEISAKNGCSQDYARQRLAKLGVHKPKGIRRPDEKEKLLPQIIARYLRGESGNYISKSLHLDATFVYSAIKDAGVSGKRNEIKHQAMRCYKAQGHTMQEVADLFGVDRGTAQQICKGIAPQHAKGKPNKYKGILQDDDKVAQSISKYLPEYEYAGNYTGGDGRVDLRCKIHGTVFNRSMISVRHKDIKCPDCMRQAREKTNKIKQLAQEQKAKEKARREEERANRRIEKERLEAQRRASMIHACLVCGRETVRPKYCCQECANKANNKTKETRRREKIESVMVDNDITVEGLFRRDAGKCWLCGERCSFEDYTVKAGNFIVGNRYPSIDHVIPLARGGEHSWNNVRLAHHRCNTIKRDNVV